MENPGYTDAEVDADLRGQWSLLDEETRSRFIPMGSDMTHVSRQMMENAEALRQTEGTSNLLCSPFLFLRISVFALNSFIFL